MHLTVPLLVENSILMKEVRGVLLAQSALEIGRYG